MLRSAKQLEGFTLAALDGDIGRVHDLYFDDRRWAVRYLVADTAGWLSGRRVLISPIALDGAGVEDVDDLPANGRRIPIRLTRQQVRDAPGIDVDQPVWRQQENAYYRYYGWRRYWVGPRSWGTVDHPRELFDETPEGAPVDDKPPDPHLRSAKEVTGYRIEAGGDAAGRVEDFIVDDDRWVIRYVVVGTRKRWLGGRKIRISSAWVKRVSWVERSVSVDLSRQEIRDAPEWEPKAAANPQYEERLYDYYGRPLHHR